MRFEEALKKMKQGMKMKRPAWGGYWEWDPEKETIIMHCRNTDSETGKDVLDIRETQRVAYTLENMLAEDWEVADLCNCTLLGGSPQFDFQTANKYMKRGLKVKRKIPGCKEMWMEGNEYVMNDDFKGKCTPCTLRPYDIDAKDWTFA